VGVPQRCGAVLIENAELDAGDVVVEEGKRGRRYCRPHGVSSPPQSTISVSPLERRSGCVRSMHPKAKTPRPNSFPAMETLARGRNSRDGASSLPGNHQDVASLLLAG